MYLFFKKGDEDEEEEEDTSLKPSEDVDATILFTKPVNSNGQFAQISERDHSFLL